MHRPNDRSAVRNEKTMQTTFFHESTPYQSSPPAEFTFNGASYEARLFRACRGMTGFYIYNKTADIETCEIVEDGFIPSREMTLPDGQCFYVSARLGDWLERAPLVKALGLTLLLA